MGLLIAAIVNNFTQTIESPASFRIPIALQFVWGAILFLGLTILPETPRYLIKRGQHENAAQSLSRIRRLDITHPALIDELAEIEANHAYELSLGPSTYRDVFRGSPHLGRRLLTGCGLQMFQQFSGINFVMYYGTTYFAHQALSTPFASGFVIQLIVNIVNVVSTLPGMVLVESWGRRRLLLAGATGMAISQLIIAAVGTALGTTTTANLVLIVFICIYIFFFAASWGPVAWVVTSEIYPLKVRAKSMSISTASNWLINWAIAYSTPYMINSGVGYADLQAKVFFVWGTCCIFAIIFVYCMVYETSTISLEQIDEMYERVDHAWRSASFEPSWSFQEIHAENTTGVASGVSLTDREEARRRAGPENAPSSSGGGSDTISRSHTTSSTAASSSTLTEEDKIIASLGNVDFSL